MASVKVRIVFDKISNQHWQIFIVMNGQILNKSGHSATYMSQNIANFGRNIKLLFNGYCWCL